MLLSVWRPAPLSRAARGLASAGPRSMLRQRCKIRRVRQLARFCVAFLLASTSLRLFALDPRLPLTEYQRKSWTVQDDYSLGEVLALAQTPDGFLWVGTSRGLRRFDGVNFTRLNGD